MHRQLFHRDGKSVTAQQVHTKALIGKRQVRLVIVVTATLLIGGLAGCASHDPAHATSDPTAKVRLTRLTKFYQNYTAFKKKPPANEEEFKEYLHTLPQEEKVAAGVVGDDVESLLVSPRDGKKYHIEYGKIIRPAGRNQAWAWEEVGQNGKRYVALTMGYVQEYDDEAFQNYKPKK
jgi:hypothetical protein